MTAVPPLGICTGTVEPGIAFGGFGPVDAFMWRGACVGGCGWRPGTRPDGPRPECMDCARARHGLGDPYVQRGAWAPAVHALGVGFVPNVARVLALPVGNVDRWTVPRPAVEVSPTDTSLPQGVRALVTLAPADRTRVTLVVAVDGDGAVLASLAVRVPGVGYAVYTRGEEGAWAFRNGVVLDDGVMRPANVGRFAAALRGEEYVPPAPREAAAKGTCPTCGAEVNLTKGGAVYASHKCQTRAIEGRL